MIDVYMLVKEGVLAFDGVARRVKGVSFCELDERIFPEMTELIGAEESGFLARLEELVLFQDIPETQTLDSDDALTQFREVLLEEQGERVDEVIAAKVEEKRRHLLFRRMFPFDFINLDFCDRYYGAPPDVMKIHSTIDRLLEWQRQPGTAASGGAFSVGTFVVAITCRVDVTTPPDALNRLKQIVRTNCAEYVTYKQALSDRAVNNLDEWATRAPLDFFMSAWPKEIARLAKQKSWDIVVHHHAFYDRQNDEGEPYNMVCLVVEFTQALICHTYLEAVTTCLDMSARKEIPRFDPDQGDGVALLADLRDIVALRNAQAKTFARDLLPDPFYEITRLRAAGIPI
jgi:hypothetical protein